MATIVETRRPGRPGSRPAGARTPRGAAGAPRARLALVVFISGTATMALQMCAVRLLAPWVGASSTVWATIIGLSLLAMSLGYVLGGRLADRRVDGATLARTVLAAALLTAAIPIVAPRLLPHATLLVTDTAWADFVGSSIAYGVLFLAPALLLGITPPYAIRLALGTVEDTGRTAGGLYAVSTLGSILGTLLAGLVLVQWIGTRATLAAIVLALLAAGLVARGARPAVGRRATGAPAAIVGPGQGSGTAAVPIALAAAIVLVEGFAMMATEMSAARLVAPFYGASHAVWAVIIATVMGSIALGSHIGGRAADRWPTLGPLAVLLAVAATSIGVLPFVASAVMRTSTGGIDQVQVGVVVGSFAATMALLVVPVTLLGMVPPWALRLAIPDVERAGRTAGRLYALSTAGALLGTFASVLWLIPAVGTRRTILVSAGALALLALALAARAATGRSGARMPLLASGAGAAVLLLLAAAPTGLVKPLDGARVLEERESRYQFIQVVEDETGRRLLQLNEGWAVHSIWHPDTVLTGGIWDHFLVLPALRAQQRDEAGAGAELLVVGSAAGTARRAYGELHPGVEVTSVELDPEVTAVGRRWFALEGAVTAADGRPFLARSRRSWDLIHVDAYRQPYIPFYLTTREFFELAARRLSPGGVVSINVGSTPEDQRINEAVAATMREVFPLVARYRAERYNEVIVGVAEPDLGIEQLRERIGDVVDARGNGAVARLHHAFAAGLVPVERDRRRVLTDDRAPVEWMTDRMIFGAAE